MPDYDALLRKGEELRQPGRSLVPVNGNPVRTIGQHLSIALQTGQPFAQIAQEADRAKFQQFMDLTSEIATTVPEARRAEFYDTLLGMADSELDDGTPEGTLRLATQVAAQMGGAAGPRTTGLPGGYMWNEDQTGAVPIPGIEVKGVNINGRLVNPYTGMPIGPATAGADAATFEGTSLKAQAWNIILDANNNPTPGVFDSHDYAVAWEIVNEPDVREIQNEGGTISWARIPPQIPPNLRRPGQATVLAAGGADAVTPIPGTERPRQFNQPQLDAAGFASRLQTAGQGLDQLAQGGFAPDPLQEGLLSVPGGNYLASSQYQQFDQFRREFINAQLRRESGAAISDTEFDSANRQYIPMPGDSPEVLQQKAQSRALAIQNMAVASGGAFEQLFGTAVTPTAAPVPTYQNDEGVVIYWRNGRWELEDGSPYE